ncbi:FUSC family protein, partial [Klebsiella pneumoniae]
MNLQTLSWRALPWVKATRPQWRYALRNGIAMCLALSIAYALDLDEPYWAMTSAAVV